jgi:hypothetical protein
MATLDDKAGAIVASCARAILFVVQIHAIDWSIFSFYSAPIKSPLSVRPVPWIAFFLKRRDLPVAGGHWLLQKKSEKSCPGKETFFRGAFRHFANGRTKTEPYIYLFDIFNNPTEELRKYWNENTNHWIPYRKYEYLYDNNGNLLLKTRIDTNETTNQWVKKWKVDYLYDINIRLQMNYPAAEQRGIAKE